jgi:hypothetical protein
MLDSKATALFSQQKEVNNGKCLACTELKKKNYS